MTTVFKSPIKKPQQTMSFATAASIAGELYKAIKVAQEISLASSNAGVLAARAGTDAAGFGALADFLDDLARKFIQAASNINRKAMHMSKTSSNALRTLSALNRFEKALDKGKGAKYLESLLTNHEIVSKKNKDNDILMAQNTRSLVRDLYEVKRDIDVAKALASMSLVEAVQASKSFRAQLTNNANNIASSIERIENHVSNSLKLVKTH